MEKDSDSGFDEGPEGENEQTPDSSSRARNRTVLLTPEFTNQIRARATQENEPRNTHADPPAVSHFAADAGQSGFMPVGKRVSVDTNAAAPRQRSAAASEVATTAAPRHESPRGDSVVWGKVSPLVGFLVTFDKDPNGEFFVLRSGRLVVTSQEPPGGNYIYIKDESVSPMHAIMRITESGEIQILDQLSEFGTSIQRFASDEVISLSGDKCSLDHGDIIKFGKRSFLVCVLARTEGT